MVLIASSYIFLADLTAYTEMDLAMFTSLTDSTEDFIVRIRSDPIVTTWLTD